MTVLPEIQISRCAQALHFLVSYALPHFNITMKTDRAFYKKTRNNSIIKLVRERNTVNVFYIYNEFIAQIQFRVFAH